MCNFKNFQITALNFVLEAFLAFFRVKRSKRLKTLLEQNLKRKSKNEIHDLYLIFYFIHYEPKKKFIGSTLHPTEHVLKIA